VCVRDEIEQLNSLLFLLTKFSSLTKETHYNVEFNSKEITQSYVFGGAGRVAHRTQLELYSTAPSVGR
jgi:hypothetical protein